MSKSKRQEKNYEILVIAFSGACVPLTRGGNIIVDGVLASCYASVDHDLAHFVMTPIQWFPEIMQWIFGEVNGSSAFAQIADAWAKWVLPEDQFM